MDHYLKAADHAALTTALIAAGILTVTEDGEQITAGYAIDLIGQISKPTGETLTVDGIETPEMAVVPGYHANLRGDLDDVQTAALGDVLLTVPPAQPYRVWA